MPSGWVDSGQKLSEAINNTARNGVWLGLSTTTTSYSSAGTEVTGGSYARRQITWAAATSPVALQAQKLAATSVGFPGMPATTVVGYNIWTASTAGNRFYWANFVTPISVSAGQALIVNASSIATQLRVQATVDNNTATVSDKFLRDILDNSFSTTALYGGSARLGLVTSVGTNTTPGTEVSGGSYARQAITATFNYYSNYIRIANSVTFTNLPAATIVGLQGYNFNGDYLFFSPISPRTVSAGSSVVVPSSWLLNDFSWQPG